MPEVGSGPGSSPRRRDRRATLHPVPVRRIHLSPKELSLAGQILAARCRAEGIDLPRVKERGGWRQTNLYPRTLLEAWEEHRLAWEAEWHQVRAARREVRSQQEGTEGQEGEGASIAGPPGLSDAARK
jgi:hypothetical protein